MKLLNFCLMHVCVQDLKFSFVFNGLFSFKTISCLIYEHGRQVHAATIVANFNYVMIFNMMLEKNVIHFQHSEEIPN